MSKYQFPEKVTIGEKYIDLLPKITTPEEAAEYFEACVEHLLRFGHSREQAESIERGNIGYAAGYFSTQEAARIQQLFAAPHPIFGNAANKR